MARTRGQGEKGIALVSAVVILALLLVATAGTLRLLESELWAAGRARSRAQARYTAEAGLHHAIALLAPGTTFAPVVAGSGGLVDGAAGGPLPQAGGGWVAFPGPPFGYAVTAHALADAPATSGAPASERLRLVARATAVRGAGRTMQAVVGRAGDAYAPAALVVAGGELVLEGDAVAGVGEPPRVVIDGGAAAGDAPSALAAPGDTSREAVLAALAAGRGVALGTHASGAVRAADLAAYLAATGLAAVAPGDLVSPIGSADAPAARRVGTGIVAGLAGYGAIVADGDLELRGDVAWSGVVLVRGVLTVDAATCDVVGMAWARSVRLRRACHIRFDAAAVRAADRALRLPRLPTILALLDS